MEQRKFNRRVKVIVLGNAEVGKSTLIKTLIPDSINIEHGGRTIALDFGVIEKKGIRFHIFGTPGQKRFEIVRDVVSVGAEIFIYVFDPIIGFSDYDKELIPMLKKKGLKGIIFINLREEMDEKNKIDKFLSFINSFDFDTLTGSAKNPYIKKLILDKLLSLVYER